MFRSNKLIEVFPMHPRYAKLTSLLMTGLSALLTPVYAVKDTSASARLRIHTNEVVERADRHKLIGTNVSLWTEPTLLAESRFREGIRDWAPGLIRLPGGSWSNEYYWNGNGVRIGPDHGPKNFDASKQRDDGTWEVDFSGYAPGFRLHGEDLHLSDYHGAIDVQAQHAFIDAVGSKGMVTVNVGSATPRVAAEWVKWANRKEGYDVRYWEVGNELNGDWEMGHRRPDGSSMTGERYAGIFREYAATMRKEDPSIKLGGPACSDLSLAFVEELIRDGGDAVDFISIHAYPVGVNTRQSAGKFAGVEEIRRAVKQIDKWIAAYQPDRKEEIEIGITEWNIKVNEDQDTADLINGLWSALWIGTLFETGVDFANQWDLVTQTQEGGHSAFFHRGNEVLPKSQYWALWMWGHLMGNELIASDLKGSKALKSFVTRSEEGLQIMLINTSETKEYDLAIALEGAKQTHGKGRLHRFSRAEYFWDPHARAPLWSLQPTMHAVDLSGNRTVRIPKFSLSVIRLPWDSDTNEAIPAKLETRGQLELRLPSRSAADRPIEGWVVARDTIRQRPDLGFPQAVRLEAEGPADLSSGTVRLENGAAPFILTPTGAGMVTIRAEGFDASAEDSLELVALAEQRTIYWTFDNPVHQWQAQSTFDLQSEASVRPNQYVAATRLQNDLPGREADLLFHFEPLPKNLPYASIGGIVAKLQAAHNLRCDDPDASINLILQSDANHWIPIGSVRLADLSGRWQPIEFRIEDPQVRDAMAKLYSIRFQIVSRSPISGEIYLDDLGFIHLTGL